MTRLAVGEIHFEKTVRHRTYIYRKSCNTPPRMNQREGERIQELCARIAVEQDRDKFMALVEELNRVLASENDRNKQNETKNQEDRPEKS